MKYHFKLKKNIHMYNHLLIVSDGEKSYSAIVESAPTKKETMIIWLEDFAFPVKEIDTIKTEMTKWFAAQNIACIFNPGKGR